MQPTVNILGVAGSMRADSYSTKALKISLELAKKYGAEVSRRLEMMSRDLVAYSRLIREQFARDLESSEPYTFAAHYRVLLKPA